MASLSPFWCSRALSRVHSRLVGEMMMLFLIFHPFDLYTFKSSSSSSGVSHSCFVNSIFFLFGGVIYIVLAC